MHQPCTSRARAVHLPGGLVVRIQRSHCCSPGSVPGQGAMCLCGFCSSLYNPSCRKRGEVTGHFLEHCQGALEQSRETQILRAPVKLLNAPTVISAVCGFMYINVCFKPSETVISWIFLPLRHRDGTGVCPSGIHLHLVCHICGR